MEELYAQCLEIGRNNKMKECSAQLSQFLRKNSYFRAWEKTNTNLDSYTRNYSTFLRFETFAPGKIIYTITPPKQFYIVSGRALVITPKKESSQLLFNNYVERVTKKIKKGGFSLEEEDEDCPSKDYYKTQLILKPGDGFGEIQYTRSVLLALDELNVFTCMSNNYQKCFELILSRNAFLSETLNKILPLVDKTEIANDIVPLFVEHSFCSSDDIFQRNQKINQFYILRQGLCEIYIDSNDPQDSNDDSASGISQKKATINIKQGELFGHEDSTGSTNIRAFSCRSISPNTIIYAIDRESLMNNKNSKIRSLVLNNAFSRYHYYIQNFKSIGLSMRQEKSIVIRSPQISSTNLISSSQPYLPVLTNQSSIQLSSQSSQQSTLKPLSLNEDKISQQPENIKQSLSQSARYQSQTNLPSADPKSPLPFQSPMQNKSNIKQIRYGSQHVQENTNSKKLSKPITVQSSNISIASANPRTTEMKNNFLSPKHSSEKKSTSSTAKQLTNSAPPQIEKVQTLESEGNEQKTTSEKGEEKYPMKEGAKNNINLQVSIDYIKSLRVSHEPHKFKTSSLLSYFSPQPINTSTSLTHLDDTVEETVKIEPPSGDQRQKGVTKQHFHTSDNHRITRSFKLLNEVDENDTSQESFQRENIVEDDIFKRKLFGGTNLSAYKRSQIAKKNAQSIAGSDPTKQTTHKRTHIKKISMFSLDKRVRFKGLEEINIENFNNYDDVIPKQQKFSSMSVLPELQSPIKSILRKKEDIFCVKVASPPPQAPALNQVKLSSKTLKQLEGITQQRVITIKKKSLSQKNLIIQQINQKH